MSENIVPQPEENTPDEVEELVDELEIHSAIDAPDDPGADTNGCTGTCAACSATC
ncbi:hypothetical protein [Nonomuraea sp. NPDC050643]|uniref:hypothetical protein n=1 Tax=Nonomuraea sp. NPDC050643 TaxID=3155660 RepID=UPI0033CC5249